MTLTIEERERRAYIEGNLELADVLGGEIESLRAEVRDLENQLDEIENAE